MHGQGRRRGWIRAALACVILLFAAGTAAATDSPILRVDFLAVGQGDAALITSPTGKTVLIDGGPREAGASILKFVRERTRAPLDLVLLTHRHADHLGGLAEVLRGQGARLFMDAPVSHPSPAYAALIEVVAQKKIPVRQAGRGRVIDLGAGVSLTLLTPPEPLIVGSRSDVNSNSVVARVDYGQVSLLFAADAEAVTEKWLMAMGANLRATVLKVAHHGSRYSSTAHFIEAVRPQVAVVSVGTGNDYGHPADSTLARLRGVGARVYRTDMDGTITVETDGRGIKERTEYPAQEPR